MNTVNHNVSVSDGQTIDLGTCGVSGSSASGDTYLRLFNAAGSQVAANDDACSSTSSRITYTVPSGGGGTYQIRAGCYADTSCSGTVAYTVQ